MQGYPPPVLILQTQKQTGAGGGLRGTPIQLAKHVQGMYKGTKLYGTCSPSVKISNLKLSLTHPDGQTHTPSDTVALQERAGQRCKSTALPLMQMPQRSYKGRPMR